MFRRDVDPVAYVVRARGLALPIVDFLHDFLGALHRGGCFVLYLLHSFGEDGGCFVGGVGQGFYSGEGVSTVEHKKRVNPVEELTEFR